jgi:hypothetical protein
MEEWKREIRASDIKDKKQHIFESSILCNGNIFDVTDYMDYYSIPNRAIMVKPCPITV